jgi:NAD(P)-dependent dehydrogenase (short-subunit alcohol dehydrogenase family)
MCRLGGKIALVTGGNSGIGLATAKQFVRESAYVFITGRRKAELDAAAKEIGRNVTGVQGDVSNLADLDRLFDQIKREKGKIDIVFANAGVARYAALGAITGEFFDSIFDTNVKGVVFTGSEGAASAGRRRIHHSQCVDGWQQRTARIQHLLPKAAVRSFARTWTTDLKERRIRVNAVSPGSIDTPAARALLASSAVGEKRKKMIAETIPLGRFGTPDETAKAVAFLASDDSSYITGIELFVDGGFAQV